jgi:hypothetical protein
MAGDLQPGSRRLVVVVANDLARRAMQRNGSPEKPGDKTVGRS